MSFPNLSALAVRERATTLFFILLSVIAGLYAFLSLGRAEDPAFTVRVLVVSAQWPGATAEQMQEQVADRLEKRIQEIHYLYRIETTVRPGRADLKVEFQDYAPNAMIPDLFYEVRKRMLDEATRMPAGVIGPIVNDDFSDVYYSLVALSAPGMPLRDLTREAEKIRDRMQLIDGARKAVVLGERTEQLRIEFDLPKLLNLGIEVAELFDAIEAHNQLLPAGFVDLAGPRVQVRVPADLSDPARLAALPIRVGEQLLQLGDLATIVQGYADPPNYIVRAHGEDVLLLGLVMQSGENGLIFGQRLEEFLATERARLPLGMQLTVLTNQREAITKAVDLFQIKFFVAVLVVMGVTVLAIGWRAGIVVGIAIPITLGLTFLLMKITNINLDRITLGALILSLGLLVDDAIIAIEMMIVKMEEGWDRVRAASHAWNVTASPMLFGTLVTVAGFVPIGFAQSGVGEYAGNIFWVLAYGLLVSWLVAVIFTPYLGVKLLPEITHKHENGALYDSPRYRQLRSVIEACVLHRKRVVGATVGILVLSIFAMATLVQKQFFPGSDRTEVLISVYLPQGSAIGVTDATVQRLEALLHDMPGLQSLSSYIGAGAPRFFISVDPELPDPAFAKLIAIADSVKARDAIMQALQAHIDAGEFPEARVRVAQLLFGPPVVWPVSFRIVGDDPQLLREIGHQVRDIMTAHPNTIEPHLDWEERMPVWQLETDADALSLMGLTPRDIAQQLQFQLSGVPVTAVRQNIRTVEVRARGAREADFLPQHLEIKTRDGRKVPLTQLGELKVVYEEPVIKRVNRERALNVSSDIVNAQAPDVTLQIWRQLEEVRRALPADYRIDIAGSLEQSGKADASIQKLQPLMIILMLIFIMLQMRSFSGISIVVATAPLGLIGAVLALLLFQQPFGFVALLGLIGLAGILMRNTMILAQQVQDNFSAGMDAWSAVVEAAVRRTRPLLLTAAAAVLAFVPLTFDSFWGPLAFVMIGGVTIGTLISLLFVPALYALWYRLPHTKD